jgi:hypothetical protein
MTTPTNEEVRQQFEAAMEAEWGHFRRERLECRHDDYLNAAEHFAWQGFQAALRSPAVVALVEAANGYRLAVDGMNDAMRDGVNVQGALSSLVGAQDNLDAALAQYATLAGESHE